ncbi:GNAT family N-acetyltransferase [Flavihumibacter rivuli]|uniref:GNAT family N-acetyltransferase n=1 Tax=Flavihumibacter rivuli TaxID=2838156 RepID=UPI001BDEE48D|nr:GNAT family N-acetyltransferase [Flavihumibacter rivuli]ULQ55982.1 GNAT family N-acetyltransferase [Flavihumibacter rivuli]
MPFDLQPVLENEFLRLVPLKETDFEALYAVASDPLLWEQHPNPDRWQEPVFRGYFKGAMESGGALLVLDRQTNAVIGCSRFYDLDETNGTVLIGYTFIGRDWWGKQYNKQLKHLMLEHAFRYVDRVLFHIGVNNFRSQKSIEKIGARQIDRIEVAYYNEPSRTNFVYEIRKQDFLP